MKKHFLKTLVSAVLLACPLFGATEDIDLFVGASSGNTGAANVLLVIDNGANFSASVSDQVCRISATGQVSTSTDGRVENPTDPAVPEYINSSNSTAMNGTAGAVEQCALYNVIKGLDTSGGVAKVNIGVMVFNTNGMKAVNPATGKLTADCVGSAGGCLVYPVVPLTATAQASLLVWIKGWKTTGGSGSVGDDISGGHNIKGNNASNGASMQEAWAYLTGKMGLSGRDYVKALESDCGNNYVVFIGNAYRNNSSPGDATGDAGPRTALSNGNSVALKNASPLATAVQRAVINNDNKTITVHCGTNTFSNLLESSENKGVYALNWALYMNEQHNIITYSIGILGPTCNPEYAAHLSKMGETGVGGGKYFGTSSFKELNEAFKKILGEIQSVNSVFASVSLPVSVNTQGTYLNQVYIGMFRPDVQIAPRWAGNLKQYKLGMVNSELKLLDADNAGAISSTNGFITECARSFWTPKTFNSYWSAGDKYQKGTCTAIENALNSDYPDGNVVEKGAQGFKLRSITPASRTVKTCSPTFGSCTVLTDFATTNSAITEELLTPVTVPATATITAAQKNNLINWARGQNIDTGSLPDGELNKGTTVMRPSAHGDVVHSRPVALNHGTDAAPKVVVYYGTNDGLLRAVNGNRDGAAGDIESAGRTYGPGEELWSFMPPEFYPNIKRLHDNSPTIKLRTTGVPGEVPKPYGFDGPITAYTKGNTSWLYATMRRGGRVLYSFDVSTPGNPTLKWKKGCPNNLSETGTAVDTGCINDATGDFTGMGQTWSTAKTLLASGYESGASPMLVMGGGYDTCEDTDDGTANHSCTTTTKGNKIYILDAANGSALRTFTTARAVAGDITIVKDNATGMAKYAYATDLGGNVYRISGANPNVPFGSTVPGNWTMTKIASLGCDTAVTCPANRKFMFAPDVVFDNGMYVLLIGSGDREKPLNDFVAASKVQNHFFMIKDDPSDATWLSSETATCGSAIICKNSLLAITSDANPTQASVDAKKGWYLGLATGEQVVTTSVTVFGTVSFSTHQPATPQPGSCGGNLGTAHVYNITYTNATSANGTASRYERLKGDGLPPSPVAGQVTLDDGVTTVPFCIGCSASSALEGKLKIKPSSTSASIYKSRVYWYIRQ